MVILARAGDVWQSARLGSTWRGRSVSLSRSAWSAKYAHAIESLYAAAGERARIDRPGQQEAGVEGASVTSAEIAPPLGGS
jgi:hypothetical protein